MDSIYVRILFVLFHVQLVGALKGDYVSFAQQQLKETGNYTELFVL